MNEPAARAGTARGRGDVPFEDPISSLPLTAQKILTAARRLLEERGYEAMTLENVAAEAGVNKASIRYNFENKAGLVIAVVDAYIHDECLRLAARIRDVPQRDVVATAMTGMRDMLVEAHAFQGFFDILPHAFRDPELRGRLLALYEWWYLQNLSWLGLRAHPGAETNETLVGLAELMCAVIDGLCIQAGLQPGGFDMDRALATFGLLIDRSMDELRATAARSGDDAGEEHTEAATRVSLPGERRSRT